MRFLVDESTGPHVARWLREQSYDVFSVYDDARRITDDEIISKAFSEGWILVTNDKDFGDQLYRDGKSHKGVILLRLDDERSATKIQVLKQLLENFADRLENQFVVATEKSVRFARQH